MYSLVITNKNVNKHIIKEIAKSSKRYKPYSLKTFLIIRLQYFKDQQHFKEHQKI